MSLRSASLLSFLIGWLSLAGSALAQLTPGEQVVTDANGARWLAVDPATGENQLLSLEQRRA